MVTFEEIMGLIRSKYGSLETPTFQWVQETATADPYASLRVTLAREFDVEDITDLNTDVCFSYQVGSGVVERKWTLRISMLGPFAVITRHWVSDRALVIVNGPYDIQDAKEAMIIDLCSQFGLQVLDRTILRRPVPLVLFDTSPGRVKVYQALFEDVEFLPGEFTGLGTLAAD